MEIPLTVYAALSGVGITIDLQATHGVKLLQKLLAERTGIDPSHQILLCDGRQLNPSKTLGQHDLPSEKRGVYLFDRRSLDRDARPPEKVVLHPQEVDVPATPPLPPRSSHPLVQQMLGLQTVLHFHLAQGQAYYQAGGARLASCRRCIEEQKHQSEALEQANANMDILVATMTRSVEGLLMKFHERQEKHRTLLSTFDVDIVTLRHTSLHKAISDDQHRTLLDCIPEEETRSQAKQFRLLSEDLSRRVTEFERRATHREIAETVRKERAKPAPVDLDALDRLVQEANQNYSGEHEALEVLIQNTRTIDRIVEEIQRLAETGHPTLQGAAQRALNTAQKMKMEQTTYLSSMRRADELLYGCMGHIAACKTRISQMIWDQLRLVSTIQSRMKGIMNEVTLYRESLERQDKSYSNLYHVHMMPIAYKAYLHEIVRRRAFAEAYRNQGALMAESLGAAREEEVQKREAFFRECGIHLPKFLPSFQELPPACDISLPQFDVSLPSIDKFEEIDTMGRDTFPTRTEEIRRRGSSGESDDRVLLPPGQMEELSSLQQQIRELKIENSRLREKQESSILGQLLNPSEASTGSGLTRSKGIQVETHMDTFGPFLEANPDRSLGGLPCEGDTTSSSDHPRAEFSESGEGDEGRLRVAKDLANAVHVRELEVALCEKEAELALVREKLQRIEETPLSIQFAAVEKENNEYKVILMEHANLIASYKEDCARLEKALHEAQEEQRSTHDKLVCYKEDLDDAEKVANMQGAAYTELCESYRVLRSHMVDICTFLREGNVGPLGSAEGEGTLVDGEDSVAVVVEWILNRIKNLRTECSRAREECNQLYQDVVRSQEETKAAMTQAEEAKSQAEDLRSVLAQSLEEQEKQEKRIHEEQYRKAIQLSNFGADDLVLFVRNEHGAYEAFNMGPSRYFLADESREALLAVERFGEDRWSAKFVVGQILYVEARPAVTNNPYGLMEGEEYHIVLASPVT